MARIFLLLLAIVFFHPSYSSKLQYQDIDALQIYNNFDLDMAIKMNQNSLVLFHAQLCEPSRKILQLLTEVRKAYAEQAINIRYINVQLDPKVAQNHQINSFPSLVLFTSRGKQQTVYDREPTLKSLQYFIDIKMNGSLPKLIDKNSVKLAPSDFMLIFIGNENLFPKLYQYFLKLSLSQPPYDFYYGKDPYLFRQQYYIYNQQQEEMYNLNNSHILLIRKSDKFQKFCKFTLEEESEQNKTIIRNQLDTFIKSYQKPYFIKQFTHNIRNYLIKEGHLLITLFYRDQTSRDNYLKSSFYNATRDYRHALHKPHVLPDNYNSVYFKEKHQELDEKVIFAMLDLEDDMTRRLGQFIGISYQDLPAIYSVRFRNQKFEKSHYQFSSNMYVYLSEIISWISNHFHDRGIDQLLHQKKINTDFFLKNAEEFIPAEIANFNQQSRVIELGKYSLEKLLDQKYSQMNNKKVYIIAYFISQFCLSCKQIDVIFTEMSAKTQFLETDKYKIMFGRIESYYQDYSFDNVTELPTIRFYTDISHYQNLDVQSIIDSQQPIKLLHQHVLKLSNSNSHTDL